MTARRQFSDGDQGLERGDIRARLERLDGQFAAGLEDDDRLSSGISAEQRAADLEFVLMSGVTRYNVPTEQIAPIVRSRGPVDVDAPLSFYEPGVADVDASMAPPSLDNVVVHEDVLRVPERHEGPAEESWHRAPVDQNPDEQPEPDPGPTVLDPNSVLDIGEILSEIGDSFYDMPTGTPSVQLAGGFDVAARLVGEQPPAPVAHEAPAQFTPVDEPFPGSAENFSSAAPVEIPQPQEETVEAAAPELDEQADEPPSISIEDVSPVEAQQAQPVFDLEAEILAYLNEIAEDEPPAIQVPAEAPEALEQEVQAEEEAHPAVVDLEAEVAAFIDTNALEPPEQAEEIPASAEIFEEQASVEEPEPAVVDLESEVAAFIETNAPEPPERAEEAPASVEVFEEEAPVEELEPAVVDLEAEVAAFIETNAPEPTEQPEELTASAEIFEEEAPVEEPGPAVVDLEAEVAAFIETNAPEISNQPEETPASVEVFEEEASVEEPEPAVVDLESEVAAFIDTNALEPPEQVEEIPASAEIFEEESSVEEPEPVVVDLEAEVAAFIETNAIEPAEHPEELTAFVEVFEEEVSVEEPGPAVVDLESEVAAFIDTYAIEPPEQAEEIPASAEIFEEESSVEEPEPAVVDHESEVAAFIETNAIEPTEQPEELTASMEVFEEQASVEEPEPAVVDLEAELAAYIQTNAPEPLEQPEEMPAPTSVFEEEASVEEAQPAVIDLEAEIAAFIETNAPEPLEQPEEVPASIEVFEEESSVEEPEPAVVDHESEVAAFIETNAPEPLEQPEEVPAPTSVFEEEASVEEAQPAAVDLEAEIAAFIETNAIAPPEQPEEVPASIDNFEEKSAIEQEVVAFIDRHAPAEETPPAEELEPPIVDFEAEVAAFIAQHTPAPASPAPADDDVPAEVDSADDEQPIDLEAEVAAFIERHLPAEDNEPAAQEEFAAEEAPASEFTANLVDLDALTEELAAKVAAFVVQHPPVDPVEPRAVEIPSIFEDESSAEEYQPEIINLNAPELLESFDTAEAAGPEFAEEEAPVVFEPVDDDSEQECVPDDETAPLSEDEGDFTPDDVDLAALTAQCLAGSLTPDISLPRKSDSLVEAEQLVQALEAQPRDASPKEEILAAAPVSAPGAEKLPALAVDTETDATVYHKPAGRHSNRRSRDSKRRARRKIARWCVRFSFAAIIVVAGIAGYQEIKPQFASPKMMLAEAHKLMNSGEMMAASKKFASFATLFPGESERDEAQFLAAYCAMIAPASDFDAESANLTAALELLEKFTADNPTHAKASRARTLAGQLYFRLGKYEKAIDLLRDQDLRLKDPEAAIPALRTLARAYTQLGDYAAAESAYLQSAAMSGNYTPDVDYDQLGDLLKLRADHADTEDARLEFRNKAVEYWNDAVRVPGLDPANKTKIEAKRDWLAAQNPSTEAPAVDNGAAEQRETAVPDAPANPQPAPEPAPQEAPAAQAGPNPAAEFEFLSPDKAKKEDAR